MTITTYAALPPVQRVPGAGLELAWREWNADAPGPPLVLLHGITGSSRDWQATAALIHNRRVIALDARGHGESEWDPGEAYAVDMHFADLAVALDALEIERCVLTGFSMGGGVAILTAAAMPERVAALAVIDAYPHPEQTQGSAGIARWVAGAAHETRWFDPAISRHFRELLAAGVATRADLRGLWQAVACETVLVRGSESNVLPARLAAEMIASLPYARLETLEGVGHPIPFRRPVELAAILSSLGGR
ncbi:MAG: alpha/beta fold hydrolase [Dehalococcoidia bacterium]